LEQVDFGVASPKLPGPSQFGQGVQADHDPNECDARKDQLIVHEEINRQGNAKDEHESPEPTSSRCSIHRLSIGLIGRPVARIRPAVEH
jgi:hypothetical protein